MALITSLAYVALITRATSSSEIATTKVYSEPRDHDPLGTSRGPSKRESGRVRDLLRTKISKALLKSSW
eukprot:COSAG06_NODE_27642_length_589_cov_1.051020_1_plen_68_part_10